MKSYIRKSAVQNAINTMGLFPFGRKNSSRSKSSVAAEGNMNMNKKQQPLRKLQHKNSSNKKKKVRFTPYGPTLHSYEFNWELEGDYWFSKAELKTFNEVRFDEADVLRKERGIRTKSRHDADGIEEEDDRNNFIGDALTHALDDDNDGHDISLRGIEHFVWPVLQKEMMMRKKELKKVVLEWRLPANRRKDPNGIKLAEDSAKLSEWARDVAQERGIKYLVQNTRTYKMNQRVNGRLSGVVRKGFISKDMGSKNNIYGIRPSFFSGSSWSVRRRSTAKSLRRLRSSFGVSRSRRNPLYDYQLLIEG